MQFLFRKRFRRVRRLALLSLLAVSVPPFTSPMIELNPIRQRIADLQDRLASLRGYL
ncbi:MAG TPA: hypothetical protein VGE09_17410 [Pseudoxanthomonas sp.]